jgi:hypothetical protein
MKMNSKFSDDVKDAVAYLLRLDSEELSKLLDKCENSEYAEILDNFVFDFDVKTGIYKTEICYGSPVDMPLLPDDLFMLKSDYRINILKMNSGDEDKRTEKCKNTKASIAA